MAQATTVAANVGSMFATLDQIITPRSGDCLDSMHHAQKVGDQNIGFLQHTLTVLCNVVETLEQKMHHLSQNGTAQLIKVS